MRRSSLHAIHARVDRLAATTAVNACRGNHSRLKLTDLYEDVPAPKWPPAGSETHCACGAQIEYTHLVNVFLPDHAA